MQSLQSIHNPFGITVFGSAIIRVEPDVASLTLGVTSLKTRPRDAFGETRAGAAKVRKYLAQAGIEEVATSRISLAQKHRYNGGENHFVGYMARMAFNILLRDLDRVEEILSGAVDAGTNEVTAVEFQTSRLKEMRAQARQQAVAAAREKAQVYCEAADVRLGAVLHIEDQNPDVLRGREGHGHVISEPQIDDEGPLRTFDPGSIIIGAAVQVSFRISE
jgi:uncharacterized protein YggE